jgi:hypothetical protein
VFESIKSLLGFDTARPEARVVNLTGQGVRIKSLSGEVVTYPPSGWVARLDLVTTQPGKAAGHKSELVWVKGVTCYRRDGNVVSEAPLPDEQDNVYLLVDLACALVAPLLGEHGRWDLLAVEPHHLTHDPTGAHERLVGFDTAEEVGLHALHPNNRARVPIYPRDPKVTR